MPRIIAIIKNLIALLTAYIILISLYEAYYVGVHYNWKDIFLIITALSVNILLIYGIYKGQSWVVIYAIVVSVLRLVQLSPGLLGSIFGEWPGYSKFIYYLCYSLTMAFLLYVFTRKDVRAYFKKDNKCNF